MARNINKVRRQIENKRKKRGTVRQGREEQKYGFYPHHADAPYHEPEFYKWQDSEKRLMDRPKKQGNGAWVFQSLMAAVLFLLIGILFQSSHPAFEEAKAFVVTSFEEEFPFARATAWYEENFGSPLAFLPFQESLEQPVSKDTSEKIKPAAIPVTGTITESFSENGKGIVFNVGAKEKIEVIKGGVIVHAGPHEEWGTAVAVQHYEGGEAWYGMLDQVEVKLYDHVSTGASIGSVKSENGEGRYSLAIKEQGEYIDPADVFSIE